jgi:hypothetical protein
VRPDSAALPQAVAATPSGCDQLRNLLRIAGEGVMRIAGPSKEREQSLPLLLASEGNDWTGREQELKLLMDKARRTGGAAISVIAYQGGSNSPGSAKTVNSFTVPERGARNAPRINAS